MLFIAIPENLQRILKLIPVSRDSSLILLLLHFSNSYKLNHNFIIIIIIMYHQEVALFGIVLKNFFVSWKYY